MRYIKTINLWDDGVHSALVNGNLKLQVGQWIYCGNKDYRSRFISINPRSKTINAVHFGGSKSGTRKVFLFRAAIHNLQNNLDRGAITSLEFRNLAMELDR